MTGLSHQQKNQRAALLQRFNTLIHSPDLPSDQVDVGNLLKQLMLDLFSLDTAQNLPQAFEARLSANNVAFNTTRLGKWDTYVEKQARILGDASISAKERQYKIKIPQGNNSRMKRDMIATAAPQFEKFFLAADAAIAHQTGKAAALVDCSDALDSIYNASTKASNQRQANRKVEEAVASHKAVVEFEDNHDMSLEENQTELHRLKMVREELSSKKGANVFDGIPIERLLLVAIEQQKKMMIPVDPNTDYGPGLDEERRLLQKSINIAIAAEKAAAKKTALEGDDSDDDCSITSDSCSESGMSTMKMESTSTKPMTVVSTGTSRKIESFRFAFDKDVSETLPNENSSTMKMESMSTKPMTSTGTSRKIESFRFASATRMSSSVEDATASPLLRKKPFPNENSSNFTQSSVAFGDSDDSDNEKIHYRRSSTSRKNKSILDSDDEVMPDIESPPMKKRGRSANKKRKKLGYKV